MNAAKKNDKVTIYYTGKLSNGTIFQTVSEAEPLTITIGNLDVPPTLEQAIIGMTPGGSKLVKIEPDEGYGPRRADLLQTLQRNLFGKDKELHKGMILSLKVEREGVEHQVPATIVEITPETLVVDYNHPLAGHDLFFTITLLRIEENVL